MVDTMKDRLGVNDERYKIIIQVKEDYLNGKISLEEGRKILKEKIGTCTPHEFAYGEQKLKEVHEDEEIAEKMDDILELFDGILIRPENKFPANHPLGVYLREIREMEKLVDAAKIQLEKKYIKNEWLPIIEKMRQWNTHLSRKQNQLYPTLEKYGFDRPTKIMWTFDDKVRDAIKAAMVALEEDKHEEFMKMMPDVLYTITDLNQKEEEVLVPTSAKLVSDEDFVTMSRGDHEIGFVYIDTPDFYEGEGSSESSTATEEDTAKRNYRKRESAHKGVPSVHEGEKGDFARDLANLLGKYDIPFGQVVDNKSETVDPEREAKEKVLDVATGKLTLEQINLLFKNMPVDLSYVNEDELVAFYSDTKHRIFPRSANVIGREVRNCHPPTSVHVVEEIIEKFRSGAEDQVDFWINKPGAFIYVLYTAIRDEEGHFRGVLEMMQDCTRIRSLEGSQTLLTWDKGEGEDAKS